MLELLLLSGVSAPLFLLALRWWQPVAVIALAANIWDSHLGLPAHIAAGGLKIYIQDLLYLTLMAAAAVRLGGQARLPQLQALWIGFLAILGLAFAIGSSVYGTMVAATFFRRTFYLLAAASYLLSFPMDDAGLRRFMRLWVAAGLVLASLALLFWVRPDMLPTAIEMAIRTEFDSQRVLPASAALLIAQAAIIAIVSWAGDRRPRMLAAAILLLAVAMLLYHRSVWVAMLAGLAVFAARGGVALRTLLPPLLLTIVAVGVLWMLNLGSTGSDFLTASMTTAVLEPFDSDSSFAWRALGWKALLGRQIDGGAATMLFGWGYGVGYERLIEGALVDVSPHNMYLEIFINAGVVGLAAWVTFLAALVLAVLRRATSTETVLCLTILVTQLVFGLSYSLPTEQGLMIGCVAAYVVSLFRQDAAAQTPVTRSLA